MDANSLDYRYVACLFELLLPPLANHGIGLESHGQNLVARICRRTAEIKGFIVRDFGGVRLHVPTLHSQGIKFDSMPAGGATLTDHLQNVRNKVHHALLQNHVGTLLSSLGLESHGGWVIVREELSLILKPAEDTPRGSLYNYFVKDTMPFKCFLRMRMEGKYRDASLP
jgi:siderophore synthetase component